MSGQYSPGGGPRLKRQRPSATDFYDTQSTPLLADTNFATSTSASNSATHNPQLQETETPLSIKGTANAMRNYYDRRSPPRGSRRYRDESGGSSGGSSPFPHYRRRSRSRSPERTGPSRYASSNNYRPTETASIREDRERDRTNRAPVREPRGRSPDRGRDAIKAKETGSTSSRNPDLQDSPTDHTPLPITEKPANPPRGPAIPSRTPLIQPPAKASSIQTPNNERSDIPNQPGADLPKHIDQTNMFKETVGSLTDIMLRLTNLSTHQVSLTLEEAATKNKLQQCRDELRKSEVHHKSFPTSLIQQKASVTRQEQSIKEISKILKANKAEVAKTVEAFANVSVRLGQDSVAQEALLSRCGALEKDCDKLRQENQALKAKSEELETKYHGQQHDIQAMRSSSAKTDEEALAKIRNNFDQLQKTVHEEQEVLRQLQSVLEEKLVPIQQTLEDLANNHKKLAKDVEAEWGNSASSVKKLEASLADISEARDFTSVKQKLDQQEQDLQQHKKTLVELESSVRGDNPRNLHNMIHTVVQNEALYRDRIVVIEDKVASLESQMRSNVAPQIEKANPPATPLTLDVPNEKRLAQLEKQIRDAKQDAASDKDKLVFSINTLKEDLDRLKNQVSSTIPAAPDNAEMIAAEFTDRLRQCEDFVDAQKGQNDGVEECLQQFQTWRDQVDADMGELKRDVPESHDQTRHRSFPAEFEGFRQDQARNAAQLQRDLDDRVNRIVISQHATDTMFDKRIIEIEAKVDTNQMGIVDITSRVDNINTADLARHMLDQLSVQFPDAKNASEAIAKVKAQVDGVEARISSFEKQQQSVGNPQRVSETRSELESMSSELRTKVSALERQQSLRQEIDKLTGDLIKAANRQRNLESAVSTLQSRCNNHDQQYKDLRGDLDSVGNQKPTRSFASQKVGAERNVEGANLRRSTPTSNHGSVMASRAGSRQSSVVGGPDNRKRKSANGILNTQEPPNGNSVKRPRNTYSTGFVDEDSEEEADPEVYANPTDEEDEYEDDDDRNRGPLWR